MDLFSIRYPSQSYSNNSSSRGGVNLIRQQSYITAVRSANQIEQPDFGKLKEQILAFLFSLILFYLSN